MIAPDVNVLLYAFRPEAPRHDEYRAWLERACAGREPLGLSEVVLSGVVRVATNRRVFPNPVGTEAALAFVERLLDQPAAVALRPGARHWALFTGLCREANVSGDRVSDAYHAALAIEHGCEWVTTDRDFARFPGLRWRHPLDV